MQQLNGVVDLLMNYDRFTESKTSIKPMIKAAPPEAAGNAAIDSAGAAKTADPAQ